MRIIFIISYLWFNSISLIQICHASDEKNVQEPHKVAITFCQRTDIPKEINFYIFSHLKNKNTLDKVFILSKDFNKLVREFKEIFLFEYINDNSTKINSLISVPSKLYESLNNLTLIVASACIGSTKCVQKALEWGANINARKQISKNGKETALLASISTHNHEVFNVLLENNADIFIQSRHKNTVFHIAVLYDNSQALKALIEREKFLFNSNNELRTNNIRNQGNLLPIQMANILSRRKCVSLLSGYAGFISRTRVQDFSEDIDLMMQAWKSGATGLESQYYSWLVVMNDHHFDLFNSFLGNPTMQLSLADKDDKTGRNIFHAAVRSGNKKAISRLMDFTVNIDDIILSLSDHNNISLLAKQRINGMINEKDNQGNTPLHYAVMRNDLEFIKIIFSNNLIEESIQIKNNKGENPSGLTNKKYILDYLSDTSRKVFNLRKEFKDIDFNWTTHIALSQFPSGTSLPFIDLYQNIMNSQVNNDSSDVYGDT